MIKNYFLILSLLLLASEFLQAQDAQVLTFSIPTQNALQFNRFLMNPTFSAVREEEAFLSLYHRNQWIQFADSPELYMLSYSGKYSDRSGVGIGVYQQNLGVLTSFGGIGNYAYQVPLTEKMALTFGFNLAYYTSGVNKGKTVTNEMDPAIMELSNNSVLTLKPALNLSWGSFDLGFYAENLVDYDFKSSTQVKDYSEKTYSAHLMYHHTMQNQDGIFQDGYFRLLLRGRMGETEDYKMGGSVLVNFPRLGWVQSGVDDFFGVSIGAGVHLTHRLSLGYVYERVISDGIVNLGPTHEITLSFRFAPRGGDGLAYRFDNTTPHTEPQKRKPNSPTAQEDTYEEDEEETVTTVTRVTTTTTTTQKTANNAGKRMARIVEQDEDSRYKNYDKGVEIEKLRMSLDDENMDLLEILVNEDASQNLKKADFEERLDNLMAYVQRLEQTIAEKDCNCDPTETEIEETEPHTNTEPASKPIITDEKNTPKTPQSGNAKKDPALEKLQKSLNRTSDSRTQSNKFELSDNDIREMYSKNTSLKRPPIKKGNRLNIPDQEAGYYIIANVFSDPSLADKFIKELKGKGIRAHYFTNPRNNYRYVYLRKHDKWTDALISYYTNVDNTYFDTIWIMSINTN